MKWMQLAMGIGVCAILAHAALFDVEDWPRTSAPMFAHGVKMEWPRYRFRLVVDDKTLWLNRAKLPERAWRIFFRDVYKDGLRLGASPSKEERARIATFIDTVLLAAKRPGVRADLVLDRVEHDKARDFIAETTRLGSYENGIFTSVP